MARDKIRTDERRKARFLSEYKRICMRHKMMLGMVTDDDTGAEAYACIDLSRYPQQLDVMVQDVMIEDVVRGD